MGDSAQPKGRVIAMYYVLERYGAKHPCRWIARWPFVRDADFDLGTRISVPVPNPLVFPLKPLNPGAKDHGPEMPELFDGTVPVFRDDLIEALAGVGVDNVDYYPAEVREPDGSRIYRNYKAANIVGLVSAADMAKSRATVRPGGPVIDVEFDELVLDSGKARGALIFRLAEATGSIFVHRKVRDHLRASGFDKLEFLEPGDAFV